MADCTVQQIEAQRDPLRQLVGTSAADQLQKLDQLKTSGSISDQEYPTLFARVVR